MSVKFQIEAKKIFQELEPAGASSLVFFNWKDSSLWLQSSSRLRERRELITRSRWTGLDKELTWTSAQGLNSSLAFKTSIRRSFSSFPFFFPSLLLLQKQLFAIPGETRRHAGSSNNVFLPLDSPVNHVVPFQSPGFPELGGLVATRAQSGYWKLLVPNPNATSISASDTSDRPYFQG